jgi:adenosylmethionine-8-amino-7-oxononanoate transaminase/dethiobiotin synthase
MNGLIVVGTDTDAGKTTFCLQWLAALGDRFAYWKPIETGPSDSETVRRLVPTATVFEPLARFRDAVAPELAASREGRDMPGVAEIVAAVPDSPWPLVIESFGAPLSPLAGGVLQAELLAALRRPIVLVTPSAVGAVGRTLQGVSGLRTFGLSPTAIVLIGPPDEYAAGQIARHCAAAVYSIARPEHWDATALQRLAVTNAAEFSRLLSQLGDRPSPSPRNGKHPRRASGSQGPSGRECDLLKRDRAAIWHPYTPLADPDDPLPVVAAEGEFLHLADGRRLIDGISSWWTTLHGHRHPPLLAALRQAARDFDHVLFAGVTHPPAVELAELLLSSAPWTGGRVFFSDNGSTAVEVALKMAYQAWRHRGQPGRALFVGFEDGYHGDTFGAMAVGRDPVFFGKFEPLLFRTLRAPVLAERLDDTLSRHRGEVAAVIIEPLVQGAGGMRMHSVDELRAIAGVAREHGVFFIADEVMTGGGRTGSLWAFQQADIAPDLICAAKTLTGGVMPLAATLASPEIVAAFDTADRTRTFFHGHSFTAHPLACAVAAANWRELLTGRWREHVARIEACWQELIQPLIGRGNVKEVRIRGSIVAIEIDLPGGYLAEVGRTMRRICIDRGVFLRPLGNVLYALPPYCTSADSLARIAAAMQECVSSITAGA